MIRNDRQLAVSEKKYKELREASAAAEGNDRIVWQSLARDVLCEIDEYRSIRDGAVSAFEINCLDDLADALIKARIARGLTQAELAEQLGVTEQAVQKGEAGGYEKAGLARLADTADALEYTLVGRLQPANATRVLVNVVRPVFPTTHPSVPVETVTRVRGFSAGIPDGGVVSTATQKP
jgi:HTH-type transcriptional regulator/antitoxin HigA